MPASTVQGVTPSLVSETTKTEQKPEQKLLIEGDQKLSHKQMVGNVDSKEKSPTITLIGQVHGKERPSSTSEQLLVKGFAQDVGGNSAAALQTYKKAEVAFKDELLAKHGPLLSAYGLDAEWFKSTDNSVVLKSVMRDSGILDADEGAKTTLKKLLNRTGLAQKHEADKTGSANDYMFAMMTVDMARQVDPNYGAANYNYAVLELKLGQPDRALKSLKAAMEDSSFDFKKQARENDADWNSMRQNAEFRALVGLPALQT